jgi:hypothetical protein
MDSGEASKAYVRCNRHSKDIPVDLDGPLAVSTADVKCNWHSKNIDTARMRELK